MDNRFAKLTHFMAGAQKWMVLGPAGELMNFCKALWVAAGAAMVDCERKGNRKKKPTGLIGLPT
jgi:hypothetical protein